MMADTVSQESAEGTETGPETAGRHGRPKTNPRGYFSANERRGRATGAISEYMHPCLSNFFGWVPPFVFWVLPRSHSHNVDYVRAADPGVAQRPETAAR
jgi:hypothetical protein